MTQEHKLNLFTEAIYLMDKQDLENMLVQLAWKETTMEQIVDSVVEDAVADEWGGQDQ